MGILISHFTLSVSVQLNGYKLENYGNYSELRQSLIHLSKVVPGYLEVLHKLGLGLFGLLVIARVLVHEVVVVVGIDVVDGAGSCVEFL